MMKGESSSVSETLLRIKGLTVKYRTAFREITALNNLSFEVGPSQIVAVVGESGCGKSTLGLSIINLLPKPPAVIDSGELIFRETDLLRLKENELASLRGTSISMIFQEPMSSLDPVYKVGEQLDETIKVRERRKERASYGPYPTPEHANRTGSAGTLTRLVAVQLPAGRRTGGHSVEVIDALKRVQIADPEHVLDKYPHELSGGMAQRVMIAQALLERPSLLIADEPTSALDVTTQAQVLDLLRGLRKEVGTSIIFVTHDLAVAAQIADTIAVMYAGEIIEVAGAREAFKNPLHPYTEGLIRSFPRKYKDEGKLEAIAGDVPDLRSPPSGCRFHPRCKYAFDRCSRDHPVMIEVEPGHRAACFLRYGE